MQDRFNTRINEINTANINSYDKAILENTKKKKIYYTEGEHLKRKREEKIFKNKINVLY